jgi:hypothetical protein
MVVLQGMFNEELAVTDVGRGKALVSRLACGSCISRPTKMHIKRV